VARAAVVALSRGSVIDLSRVATLEEALGEKREHPLKTLFRDLEKRYVRGKVERPITYYFSLGAEDEAKWTARLAPEGCTIAPGKPDGLSADCVLKTSAEIFRRMITEAYMPTPVEIMSGQVKANDVGLLATFQEAFDIR
jgi:long-chain acyl-CoA synthetase